MTAWISARVMARARQSAGTCVAAAALAGVLAQPVQAASCSVSATAVAFGTYNPFAAQSNDSTGSIGVTCTGTVLETIAYQISLSAGSGTYTTRTLKLGSRTLNYNLYVDSLYLLKWGDTSLGTSIQSASFPLTGLPILHTYTIYGRIPSGQTTAQAGTYSDTITVTVSY